MTEPMSDTPDEDFDFIKDTPWPDEKPPMTAEEIWPAMLRYYGAAEPITVTSITDWPLPPNSPEPTEEQRRAAVESANTQIEQWWEQRGANILGYGPLAPLPNPLPLPWESLPNLWRDDPRGHDYPVGG